jgi:hypothetical protein
MLTPEHHIEIQIRLFEPKMIDLPESIRHFGECQALNEAFQPYP